MLQQQNVLQNPFFFIFDNLAYDQFIIDIQSKLYPTGRNQFSIMHFFLHL